MMPSLQSATSWAVALLALASFPSTVTTAPIDDSSLSNSISTRSSTWQAEIQLTSATYQSTYNQLTGSGYHLSSISGYTINGLPRYAAVWDQNDSTSWLASTGLNQQQFQSQILSLPSKGYQLVTLDAYTVAGSTQYAVIWNNAPSNGWIYQTGLYEYQYEAHLVEYAQQGYRVVHVSGYTLGTETVFAAIWQKPSTSVQQSEVHGVTFAQFQYMQEENWDANLFFVSTYAVNNVEYYNAIWDKVAPSPYNLVHGLSASAYQQQYNTFVGMGFRPKIVSACTINNQDLYTALFVKA